MNWNERTRYPMRSSCSATDPDAVLAIKGGAAAMAYYNNYLIASRVILEVEATPALFHQEAVAARRMVERVQKLGVRAESLGADKAYGSGEFLAWLLEREVQLHIPCLASAGIRRRAVSVLPTFAMLRERMSSIVPKARLCVIEVCNVRVRRTRRDIGALLRGRSAAVNKTSGRALEGQGQWCNFGDGNGIADAACSPPITAPPARRPCGFRRWARCPSRSPGRRRY